jgi:hypothetical protein
LAQIKSALDQTPTAPPEAREAIRKSIAKHALVIRQLNGDSFLASRYENQPTSVSDRVQNAGGAIYTIVNKPTGTQREQAKIGREELDQTKDAVKKMLDGEVKEYELILDKLGAPYTPGRGLGK